MNKYKKNKTMEPDKNGFFGQYGGAYIPEILYKVVHDLQDQYKEIIDSKEFQDEYGLLLKDYVGRPSPLYYAKRMSEKYGCKLYLKREDLNHTGAHKINNTIGQILMAKKMGKTRVIAETGAGQHGVATATVCALFDMECEIFMGKTDVERQHTNVERMKMLGAKVYPVTTGNMTLSDACTAAIRDWCCHPDTTFYIVGSTMGPHPYPDIVARLQSVISKELKWQLQEKIGRDYPDYLVACVGGGSNAAGTIYHYIEDSRVKIVLAEAGGHGVDTDHTAATIHCGTEGIVHGSRTLVMQDDDGQIKDRHKQLGQGAQPVQERILRGQIIHGPQLPPGPFRLIHLSASFRKHELRQAGGLAAGNVYFFVPAKRGPPQGSLV